MKAKDNKKIGSDIIPSRVMRGDGFYIGIATYTQSEGGKKISEFLNTKVKTIKETDYTYRIINHWESIGLIDSNRPSGKGWRKFSPLDLVWIKIIAELRRFGFPNEGILKVKSSLERYKRFKIQECSSDLFLLEFYTALVLVHHRACHLMVYNNGDAEPIILHSLIPNIQFFDADNFILISINEIVKEVFPKQKEFNIDYPNMQLLEDDESELLNLLRTTDYPEISIKRKNGKIERFDLTEFIDTKNRITEILKDGSYQDISVKQSDGKIVSIKRTIKKMAKDIFNEENLDNG